MGQFLITGPDGKQYKVTGDSAEGAVAALKKMLGGTPEAPQSSDRAARKARYDATMAKGIPDDVAAKQGAIDAQTESVMASGGMGAFAGNVANGLTFGFADNIAAGIGSVFEDRSYDEILAGLRQQRDIQETLQPKSTIAGDIVGSVAGTAPLALAKIPAAMIPSTLAGKVVAGAGAGAVVGAADGALSGAGYADGKDLGSAALKGATIGAGFGGLFGGAAPAASAGIKSVVEWVKNTDVATIAKTFGISKDAAKALKPSFDALDFGSAQRNLATAGPDAMVADAGISTRRALDTAITGGGKAARVGVDAVADRAAKSGDVLGRVMDTVLGIPEGIKTAAKSIAQRTSGIRAKAYEKAYATPINYADDTGRAIEDVLTRIPDSTLNAAIKEANEAMQAAGITNMQIMAEIADDGSVIFKEMPNVQQLDEIKKALGVVGAEVDNLGRPTAKARRAMKLAGDLKDAVAEAVPSYKTAVKLGGDKIAEDKALDMGRKIFGTGVSREDVSAMMKGASIEAKDAARKGIREFIDDTMARVRRSFDDPDVDTTETLRLLNTLSSRDARDKIVSVLGETKAGRLFTAIDAVGKQFGTRQAVAKGSETGMRLASKEALDAVLAPGAVDNLSKGKPWASFQSLVQFFTRATPEQDMARRQEVLAEMAGALTSMRGQKAQDAMAIVENAISGQPLKTADAVKLARLLSGAGALAGYQSATRGQGLLTAGPQ